jgi:hypothetical protein
MADGPSSPSFFVKNLYSKMVEKDPINRISIYEVYGRLESHEEYRQYLFSTTEEFEKLKVEI